MNSRKAFEEALTGNSKYKLYKGIAYFSDYKDAEKIENELKKKYPEVNIVRYTRGWAVQYYQSGPYYPESVEHGRTTFDPRKAFERVLEKQAAGGFILSDTEFVMKLEKLGKEVYEAAINVKMKAVPRHKASGEFDRAVKQLKAAYEDLGIVLKKGSVVVHDENVW